MATDIIAQITAFAVSSPKLSIFAFAAAISLFITIVNFFMLDKNENLKSQAKRTSG